MSPADDRSALSLMRARENSRHGTFLMTLQQHMRRAAQLAVTNLELAQSTQCSLERWKIERAATGMVGLLCSVLVMTDPKKELRDSI